MAFPPSVASSTAVVVGAAIFSLVCTLQCAVNGNAINSDNKEFADGTNANAIGGETAEPIANGVSQNENGNGIGGKTAEPIANGVSQNENGNGIKRIKLVNSNITGNVIVITKNAENNANAVPLHAIGNNNNNVVVVARKNGNGTEQIDLENNNIGANSVNDNNKMPSASAAFPTFPELDDNQKAMAVYALRMLLDALRKNKDLSWMALVIEVLLEAYTPLSQLYAAFQKERGEDGGKKELAFFGNIKSLFQRAMPNGQGEQYMKKAIGQFLEKQPQEQQELYKFVMEFVCNNYESQLDSVVAAVAQLRRHWLERLRPRFDAFMADWQAGIKRADGLPANDEPLQVWQYANYLAGYQ